MALFPVEMESDRLRYERIHPEDFDPWELYEYVNEDAPNIEEITRWMTWDPYETPKEALDWVSHCGEEFDAGEGAVYAIRPTHGERAGAFAGVTSLHPDWELRRAELGIWLRKPFWGRGYSGERAQRLFELAFERLDLEVVGVTHDPENEQSASAIETYIEAAGGRCEGHLRNDIVMNGEVRDSVRYSVTSEEWAARD
ncbi:MAG: GNAT family N-acetyltransferase [Halobacteriaceae archaeon]